MKSLFEGKPHLKKYLFDKGYLITTDKKIDVEAFPFFGNWKSCEIGNYRVLVHNRAKLYTYEDGEEVFFLVGHSLNPYTREHDELVQLRRVACEYKLGKYHEAVSELTGVFITGRIKGEELEVLLDASGMQYGCYGKVDGEMYVASHMRLVGDFRPLKTSHYVEKLISYKWYHYMMGNYLPGDLTCYDEMKRILPNMTLVFDGNTFKTDRFYPTAALKMAESEEEYNEVIKEGADILRATMELIAKKWGRCSISLTGGVDSNTTFAAASGSYDKYSSFSYVSMGRESVDSEMAKAISDRFGVKHTEYVVPTDNSEVEDYTEFRRIFLHNDGDIGREKENETRKKICLIKADVCDVEVKSWISETIRAYAYKYFGKKKFPKRLRARHYTSLYKLFFMKRSLVRETDRYFAQYIRDTGLHDRLLNYDETDFFVWEMMHGGKCGSPKPYGRMHTNILAKRNFRKD